MTPGAFDLLQSVEVRRLKVAGLREPIDVTANHPIFSEDRQDFVSARILTAGDHLRTLNGTAELESNERFVGGWEMFNLEIDGAHRYYITERAVLVHNAGENGLNPDPGDLLKLSGFSAPISGKPLKQALFVVPAWPKSSQFESGSKVAPVL